MHVAWQGVTAVTPNLRILHFKTTDVLVIRQTNPLPAIQQPAGGHRLIYHMLTGDTCTTWPRREFVSVEQMTAK